MVHFERGRCDGPLRVAYLPTFDERARSMGRPAAPFVEAGCSEAGAGWWQIDLPASIAQSLVDRPNGAIILSSPARQRAGPVLHSRETLSFAPRLLVEGVAHSN